MSSLRTLVVLESPMRKAISRIAQLEGGSISSVCRDLIREALEIYEDHYWNKAAAQREKGFDWNKALTHKQVWHKK
jgi:hypothetical protein